MNDFWAPWKDFLKTWWGHSTASAGVLVFGVASVLVMAADTAALCTTGEILFPAWFNVLNLGMMGACLLAVLPHTR